MKQRIIIGAAFAIGLSFELIGCVGDLEAWNSSDELNQALDVVADAPTPTPTPTPTPIPGCIQSYPSFASSKPYPTNHSDLLRGANRYAAGQNLPAAFLNFHTATYGAGAVLGTFLLNRSVVAAWHDVTRAELGWPALEDVPAMMRASQIYARKYGYPAALPTFEQGKIGNDVVYGVSLLSASHAEVRAIDACELGYVDPADVGGVFRAANEYAKRAGYAAALPTFEFRTGPFPAAMTTRVVLFRSGTVTWQDVFRGLIDPTCGNLGRPQCPGCVAPLVVKNGSCYYWSPPPHCGSSGEDCCSGSCDPGLVCRPPALFKANKCLEPPRVPRCGDGICDVLGGSETCACSDCTGSWVCVPGCPEGQFRSYYDFCTTCPGGYVTAVSQEACSRDAARQSVQSMYGNCSVVDGAGGSFAFCVTCAGSSPATVAQTACSASDAQQMVSLSYAQCAVVAGACP